MEGAVIKTKFSPQDYDNNATPISYVDNVIENNIYTEKEAYKLLEPIQSIRCKACSKKFTTNGS